MKQMLKCGVVLVAVFGIVVGAEAPTNRPAAFNPSGDYHPQNRPNGSERFIQFDLQVRRKQGRLVAWGEVRGVQAWYKFTSISVTEKHLKFSTARIQGVRYEFKGTFLATGRFADQSFGNGDVMLEGTLSKFVNGQRVMQLKTPFVYYPGC
jgi:hypothetical protein